VPIEVERSFKKELKAVRKLAEEALKMGDSGFTMSQLIEQEDMNQYAIQLFAEGKYGEAEIAFKRVIEIADCLPQAHNNLFMCYLAQKRFDEGEAELRRALAMKPNYWLARSNLRRLYKARRTGGELDWVSYGIPDSSRKQEPNKFIES
jgi:Flp pilus assembly protein TadD